jgi:hypothetical protein
VTFISPDFGSEEYENFTDLNAFYKTYAPAAVGNPVTVYLINGGINNQSDPGGEAALDADYAFVCGDFTPDVAPPLTLVV